MADGNLFDLLDDHRSQEAALSLAGARQPPDQMAEADKYAKALGLPTDTAVRNLDQVRRDYHLQRANSASAEAPAVQAWLADPVNAAISGADQVQHLSRVEQVWNFFKGFGDENTWERLPRGGAGYLAQSYTGLGSELDIETRRRQQYGLPGLAGKVSALSPFAPGFTPLAKMDRAAGEPGFRARGQMYGPSGEASFGKTAAPLRSYGSDPAHAPTTGAARLMDMIGSTGTGMLLTAASGGAGTVSFIGSGIQQQTENARKVDRYGWESSDDAAQLVGAIEGFGDRLGAEFVIGKAAKRLVPKELQSKFARWLFETGEAAVAEGSTEAGQQASENAANKYMVDPSQDIGEGVGQSAVFGGLFGGAVGGAVHGVGVLTEKPRPTTRDRFEQIIDAVRSSPVAGRSPERFEQLMGMMSGGTDVFVPAENVRSYLQSLTPEEQGRFVEATGIGDQLEAGLAAGADIVMPASKYLARVAPEVGPEAFKGAHEAFAPDLRIGLDGVSLAEQETFQERLDEFLKEHGDELKADLERQQAEATPARKVFDEVQRQAREAGFTVDAARQYAVLYASRYTSRAARLSTDEKPTDAWDLFQKAGTGGGVQFRSQIPEQLASKLDRVDLLLDALRRDKVEKVQRGPTLLDWISRQGGIADEGGELSARDFDRWHKDRPFRRRLVNENGRTIGDMAQAAQEAGYFNDRPPEVTLTGPELLDAMEAELRGQPRHAEERDNRREDFHEATGQLQELLDRLGLDPRTASNAELKKALDDYSKSDHEGAAYNQDAADQIDKVLRAAAGDGDPRTVARIGEASQWLTDQARAAGLDVEGFTYVVDTSAVRHIKKEHGDRKNEVARGQLPIGDDDLRAIPEVLAAPDKVIFGTTSRMGANQIAFLRKMPDGSTLLVEETRTGRHQIATKSMRRYPPATNEASILASLNPNARSNRGNELNVVDVPPDVTVIRPEGSSFDQPARGRITFTSGPAVIELFKGRDLSTVLHESGHLFLEELRTDALHIDASPQMIDDFNTVLKWLGVDHPGKIGVEEHEKFARAFEHYLMEGKAPSEGLRSAFQRFKGWLLTIYRTAMNLNVKVNPQVREVFDRLLATDQEISALKDAQGLNPIFATAKDAGMSAAEFEAYTRAVHGADDESRDKLLNRLMQDVRRRRTREWVRERDGLREEAAKAVDQRQDVRAFHFLTRGEMLGLGEGEGQPGRLSLDRDAVVGMYGTDAALDRLPKSVPPIYSAEGGAHPDEIAPLFGYRSGEDLVNDLMSLEAYRRQLRADGDKRSVRRALAEEQADQEMLFRHGDALHDGSIEQEALDALHLDTRSRLIAAEVRALGKKGAPGEAQWTADLMERWAVGVVGALKFGSVRPDVYLKAERQAGIEAQRHLLDGDIVKALERKRQQLLNFHLYKAAREAAQQVASINNRLNSYARREYPSIEISYREQLHALLERFGFRTPTEGEVEARTAFAKWVEERQQEGEAIAFDPAFAADGPARNPADLTVDELRGLADAANNIAHLGREAMKLVVGGQKADKEAAIQEALDRAMPLPSKPLNKRAGGARTPREAAVHGLRGLDAALRKIEDLAEYLDNGDGRGIWHRLLIDPATDAANLKGKLQREVGDKIGKAFWGIPKAVRDTYTNMIGQHPFIDPRDGKPMELRRGDLIAVALNVGNESNLSKLAEGYGAAPQEILALLNRYLTKDEWDFVQGVWDVLDKELWPLVAENERKLSGLMPEKVVPTAVSTPHGSYRGGYYPAVYDARLDDGALHRERRAEGDLLAAHLRVASTPKGFTKTRTSYTGPILLSIDGVLVRHLDSVFTRIAYSGFVQSARRFILDPRVRQLVTNKLGEEYYGQFMPWLQSQVIDQPFAARHLNAVEAFARKARTNWQIAVMGFSFNTGISQTIGLSTSAGVIGPQWVAHGLVKTARLATAGKLEEYVFARSEEMRQRNVELDRDMRDALREATPLNTAAARRSRALANVRKAAMYHIGFMDRFTVSVPTWIGAYDRAVHEGHNEASAVRLADKAVRKSQGSGRQKDLAAIQAKNSEFLKLFTLAYSYFNVQYNRQAEMVRDLKQGRPAKAFSSFFWIMMVAPLASALVTGDGPDDWDDAEKVAAWAGRKTFFGLFSGVPVVRDFAAGADRKLGGKFGTFGGTPFDRAGEAVWKALGDLGGAAHGDDKPHLVQHTAAGLGYLFGLPGVQVGKTAQYLTDVADGDQHPESLAEFLDGFMHGPKG